jgi:hypothetical protein
LFGEFVNKTTKYGENMEELGWGNSMSGLFGQLDEGDSIAQKRVCFVIKLVDVTE